MPAEITLAAEPGRATGSSSSKRLRAEGKVPAVVYGQGADPVSVAVDRRELRIALSGPAGVNAVINLEVSGSTKPAVVKALQRHPVRHNVTHVDFLVVNLNEEITMDVPVVLEGEAREVLAEGGLLEHHLTLLPVTTTPRNIPNELVLDVSGLSIGESLRVSDIKLPAGVSTAMDPDTIVVGATVTRAAVAEETEEGEEAEGAAEEGGAAEAGTRQQGEAAQAGSAE